MHRWHRSSLALLLLGACETDRFDGVRTDAGGSAQDGGQIGPLPLSTGDRFTFIGRMTARDGPISDDRSALYTLEVTVDAVDDQGLRGESRLTFRATGQNDFNRDWTDVYDFSSWVGRLGPSLPSDQVSGTPVDVDLGNLPELPAPPDPTRPDPKQLPTGSLFVDMRRPTAVRERFAAVHREHQPRVVDADMNNGRWRFEYRVTDPGTIITYEVPTRFIALEVDPRGVIVRVEEQLGTPDRPPYATASLELVP